MISLSLVKTVRIQLKDLDFVSPFIESHLNKVNKLRKQHNFSASAVILACKVNCMEADALRNCLAKLIVAPFKVTLNANKELQHVTVIR
jgi:hypothetical protein